MKRRKIIKIKKIMVLIPLSPLMLIELILEYSCMLVALITKKYMGYWKERLNK